MRGRPVPGALTAGAVSLAAAVAVVGVFVRPALLLPIALGAVVAALAIAVLYAIRQRRRDAGPDSGRAAAREAERADLRQPREELVVVERRSHTRHARMRSLPAPAPPAPSSARGPRWVRWVCALVALAAVGLGVVLALAGTRHAQGPSYLFRRVVPTHTVQPVFYRALLDYDESTRLWTWSERVRVPRRVLVGHAAARRRPLGRSWQLVGGLGRDRSLLLYRRSSSFAVAMHLWPLLTKASVPLPALHTPLLATTLVPRDGSVVVLQAPERMIHATDPPPERTTYGDRETLSTTFTGIEDGLAEPELRFEVANWLGRTSVYETLSGITGMGIVAWLFGIVSAGVFGFFLNRSLERRLPRPAAQR